MEKDRFAHRASDWDQPDKIEMAENFIKEVRKNITLQQDWKVLEIGAGTGLVGMSFINEIREIVFEDTSAAMLGILKQKLSNDLINKAEIVLGETELYIRLDIDLVLSNMAFHHIEDIDSLLSHLYKITKPNAFIAIGDIRTEDGSFHRFEPIPHKGFDTAMLEKKFTKNGFEVLKCYTYNILTKEKIPGKLSDYEQFFLLTQKKN